jgi:hypothetical protein
MSLSSSLPIFSLLLNDLIDRDFIFVSFEMDTEVEEEEEVKKDFIDPGVTPKASVIHKRSFKVFYSYLYYPLILLDQFSPPPEV